MALIERDDLLAELDRHVEASGTGRGSLVLLRGEAGIGKSSVVRALLDRHPDALTLIGMCDSLSTPPPLGPLRDMDEGPRSEVGRLLDGDRHRHEIFHGFLELLSPAFRSAIVVIEDVHWADDATLDLLRFLGRRIVDTRSVVVVTYRDDEVPPDHPLSAVLGSLATARGVLRRTIRPLTIEGVRQLAGDDHPDVDRLFRITDGNPFFVTEVLEASGEGVPETVRDAVLARAARAGPTARGLLDAASVVPDRVESWLIEELHAHSEADRREAIDLGLLVPTEVGLRFRHDLARRAVESAVDPERRVELHRRALQALLDPPSGRRDPARIAHHADTAGDREMIVTWGRVAAEEAVSDGAHRAALAHDLRVLEADDGLLEAADRAVVLERAAESSRLVNDPEGGLSLIAQAVRLREQIGDEERLAAALRIQAFLLWMTGRGAEATATIDDAVGRLEALPPGIELGRALAVGSHLAMLGRHVPRAIDLGERAVELAEQAGDLGTVARALNAVGSSKIVAELPGGEEDLLRSAELGERIGTPWVKASALSNLGSAFGEVRDYPRAQRYLDAAVESGRRLDLDLTVYYSMAWQARVQFEIGNWGPAVMLADRAMRGASGSPIIPIVALTVKGRVAARRGEREADDLLAEARDMADGTGDIQRTWPAAAGQAEAAWLSGAPQRIPALIGPVLEHADRLGVAWAVGELSWWLVRSGVSLGSLDLGTVPAAPYRRLLMGEWAAAAEGWERIGCRYELAEALAHGDVQQRLAAVEIWDELGAVPAARRLRASLRAEDVSVPRGARATTTANPAGLTPRQLDVLLLVAEGLTNAAIADRLFISPKTVDHHVSAVLSKLGVSSRVEAAAEAFRMGLVEERA